jgi:hypothetical protein
MTSGRDQNISAHFQTEKEKKNKNKNRTSFAGVKRKRGRIMQQKAQTGCAFTHRDKIEVVEVVVANRENAEKKIGRTE